MLINANAAKELNLAPILAVCEKIHAVGSSVTCNPPVLDTDKDYLCFTKDWREALNVAILNGFETGGSVLAEHLEKQKDCDHFTSLKRDTDKANLILTDSPIFARKFMAATEVAKRLNLIDKADRIALFQAVLYASPNFYSEI